MPPRFHLLIATQFLSALADNALLLVTIALLQRLGEPAWWVPVLKLLFVSLYVLLAPWLGPLVDSRPKAQWMQVANALKLLAVLAMVVGLSPLLAFPMAGLGAAIYAPAKYGLVTEQVPPERLVRANAWLEVSVVGAVLLGAVLGGALVGVAPAPGSPASWPGVDASVAGSGLAGPLLVLVGLYGLSQLLNRGVRDGGLHHGRPTWRFRSVLRRFRDDNRVLWQDRLGRLSLSVTLVCWGAGAALQLAVLSWAVVVLGLGLDRAAGLQAVVAVGVVVGAVLAGRHVPLAAVPRLVPLGLVMGVVVMLGSSLQTPVPAGLAMAVVGLLGGALMVPMNALLQHRGHCLLTAGRSVAVQGFNENASVLLTMAVYAALLRGGVDAPDVLFGLGLALAAATSVLWWLARRDSPVAVLPAASSSSDSN
jgi:MFS family permease